MKQPLAISKGENAVIHTRYLRNAIVPQIPTSGVRKKTYLTPSFGRSGAFIRKSKSEASG